ncbi:YjfB family protein [Marinobacter mobilis]|uniref:Putative motility protein n=1 Tax=Marinobacter mobilis TaxID=488533 RepID=A0A1H3CJC6_9GAMM|nr:YjfB family protein [Marinobacter mobilis]SDW77072.1 Putative motility protein [Marinobacter mobilis]SDX53998.1 Putative motility protein [Marinobacter mobilis]
MDISSLASFSTQLNQADVQQQAQLSVLKTAQDMAAAGALQLLDAIPSPQPSVSSGDARIGSVIDVRV